MQAQRRHVFEQALRVNVAERVQRRDVLRVFDHRGAQAPFVPHGDAEALHQRACVLAEALLARDERIAVVAVFHLPLLEVF